MERSAELQDVISGWFEAAARGDSSWTGRHISRQADVRLVGTDPTEWLEGPRVAEFLKAEAEAVGGQITVAQGPTEAFVEGSIGWGVANPTITLSNGKSFSPRWSAVFRREDGDWKAVQVHASVGVTNEALMGMEAPV